MCKLPTLSSGHFIANIAHAVKGVPIRRATQTALYNPDFTLAEIQGSFGAAAVTVDSDPEAARRYPEGAIQRVLEDLRMEEIRVAIRQVKDEFSFCDEEENISGLAHLVWEEQSAHAGRLQLTWMVHLTVNGGIEGLMPSNWVARVQATNLKVLSCQNVTRHLSGFCGRHKLPLLEKYLPRFELLPSDDRREGRGGVLSLQPMRVQLDSWLSRQFNRKLKGRYIIARRGDNSKSKGTLTSPSSQAVGTTRSPKGRFKKAINFFRETFSKWTPKTAITHSFVYATMFLELLEKDFKVPLQNSNYHLKLLIHKSGLPGGSVAAASRTTHQWSCAISFGAGDRPTAFHTALDYQVIIHEIMHTILDCYFFYPSDRILTHPLHSVSCDEGLADFVACLLGDSEVFAALSSGDARGIRPAPFTDRFAQDVGGISWAVQQTDAHSAGSMLCACLLQMARQIKDVMLVLQLVFDGLLLINGLVSFISVRDGILAAIDKRAETNTDHPAQTFRLKATVWTTFAAYGLGEGAEIFCDLMDQRVSCRPSLTVPRQFEALPALRKETDTIEVLGRVIRHQWQGRPSNQTLCLAVPLNDIRVFPGRRFDVLIRQFFHPHGVVVIGLSNRDVPLSSEQPGWYPCSVGFHSDDGKVFCHQAERKVSDGAPAGTLISCSIQNDSVYFYQDDQQVYRLPISFLVADSSTPLYPTIGVDGAEIDISIPH